VPKKNILTGKSECVDYIDLVQVKLPTFRTKEKLVIEIEGVETVLDVQLCASYSFNNFNTSCTLGLCEL